MFLSLSMAAIELQAFGWGLLAGSALLIGAALGYYLPIRQGLAARVMAFGSGVLVSVLSFDLMDEAFQRGGIYAVSVGFLTGALLYTLANGYLVKKGAKHRKRSADIQPSEAEKSGSGMAIAVGALLDGIPESIAIGITMLGGGSVSMVAVIAIFVSNVPEGLSSASGMKKAGRKASYIFGIWLGITVLSGLAAFCGYAVFSGFPDEIIAGTTALAAGAILAMLSNTMIPEAFDEVHDYTGLITALGFLAAFMLSKTSI